jgi:hypothetical protein
MLGLTDLLGEKGKLSVGPMQLDLEASRSYIISLNHTEQL